MIELQQIREKLQEAIKNSNMTQKVIANAIKVNQATIAHYLKGDKMPALDTFANLCVALDVDPAEILCIKV